ncbi:MAG TPA: phosphoribosylglycinamide formyltransferase [Dehalococcoidia bacterium]|nr:phosphoribosylglycinamide formyltransferase [Dehalococcoidia bacterium]
MTVRLAVLLSGGGRTLQNFIDLIAAGKLDASIEVVIATNPLAGGIERAKRAGIACQIVDRRGWGSDEAFSEAITSVLDGYEIDLVLLAGFMRRYLFPERFTGRVLNIHPALLPRFGGKGMYGHRVHEAVIAAGETESGCSVHLADLDYDTGPVLVQKRVPVLPNDTPDTLADRVFAAECEAYPEAVRLMAARLGMASS